MPVLLLFRYLRQLHIHSCPRLLISHWIYKCLQCQVRSRCKWKKVRTTTRTQPCYLRLLLIWDWVWNPHTQTLPAVFRPRDHEYRNAMLLFLWWNFHHPIPALQAVSLLLLVPFPLPPLLPLFLYPRQLHILSCLYLWVFRWFCKCPLWCHDTSVSQDNGKRFCCIMWTMWT